MTSPVEPPGTPKQQQSITILGTPDRSFNPLRKLVSGFCDPFIPKHDNDDEERTLDSAEESPQMQQHQATAVRATTTSTKVARSVEHHSTEDESVSRNATTFGKLEVTNTTTTTDSGPTLPPPPDQSATRAMSELTTASEAFVRDENGPEIQVSRRLTRQRRQHALQVFFASLVFVTATMATLRKLGYTSMADFHAPKNFLSQSSSSSYRDATAWGTRWIHIFDKTAADSNKLQTLKKSSNDSSDDIEVEGASQEREIPETLPVFKAESIHDPSLSREETEARTHSVGDQQSDAVDERAGSSGEQDAASTMSNEL